MSYLRLNLLLKVPITPKIFCGPNEWLCPWLSKISKKFLFLVKTGIFYEFSKFGLSAPRPGERKTGTSDVKPRHKQRQQKRKEGVFEKKLLFSWHWLRVLTFLK